jgi:formylglycine-generating enzyme required for sulfatase activity
VRGGSWFDLQALARPALRGWEYPHLRLGEYGFRLGCRPVSVRSGA